MQSLLLSTTTVWVLLHVLSSGFVTAQDTPDFNYSMVTCNFSTTNCGWTNVGGQYTATWVLDGTQAHMYLSMNGDAKGRLASPWLDPLEDYQCSLKFDFVVDKWSWQGCGLALIRQTASGSEQKLKVMDYDTGFRTSSDTATEDINCTGERYRIVFEGWKSCDHIWVDDIVYTLRYTGTPRPTDLTSTAGTTDTTGSDDTETSPTSSAPYVTSSTSLYVTSPTSEQVTSSTSYRVTSSTSPHVTSATSPHVTSSTNEDGSTDSMQGEADTNSSALDAGSLAGIIIGGIVVVVVVIVIVMLIFKRRRRQDKPTVDSPGQESLTIVNSLYGAMPNEQGRGGPRRNHPASSSEGMELAPLPPSNTTPPPASSNGSFNLRPSSVPASPSVMDSDTYENVAPPRVARPSEVSKGANRQNHLTSKPDASSVTASDDVYDHISRAQLRPVPDNPYDHANKASLGPAFPPSVSENTYNHMNERLLPSMPDGSASDTYNHLHLDSHPAADTPSDDAYTNVPQPHQPTSDVYAQPQKKRDRKRHQGNDKTPPTTTTTSASSSSAGFGPVGISGHGGAAQNTRASADAADPYNRLDVTGEMRRQEEGVGENVYDHAKANDYDSLHDDDRKRTQQRQLAQDDYSHI